MATGDPLCGCGCGGYANACVSASTLGPDYYNFLWDDGPNTFHDMDETVLPQRIVFLDIDGVLNSIDWMHDKKNVAHVDDQIDPRAVDLLNELAPPETTKIVVSSTWRLMGIDNVTRDLKNAGVKAEIIGVTPDLVSLGDYRRGTEIAEWLSDNGCQGASYVIIDDDHDAGIGHGERFVKTDVRTGLTAKHVAMAHAIFERDDFNRAVERLVIR